ncbi:MAG: hypothetical protein FWE38_02940 [Firmicutes bacterium]|nr:hypothetical protein [Bacillota bacterium]
MGKLSKEQIERIEAEMYSDFLQNGYWKNPGMMRGVKIFGALFLAYLALVLSVTIFVEPGNVYFHRLVTAVSWVGMGMSGLFGFVYFYVEVMAPRKHKEAMRGEEQKAEVKAMMVKELEWMQKSVFQKFWAWAFFIIILNLFILIPAIWITRFDYLEVNDMSLWPDPYFLTSIGIFLGGSALGILYVMIKAGRERRAVKRVARHPNRITGTGSVMNVEEAGRHTSYVNGRVSSWSSTDRLTIAVDGRDDVMLTTMWKYSSKNGRKAARRRMRVEFEWVPNESEWCHVLELKAAPRKSKIEVDVTNFED